MKIARWHVILMEGIVVSLILRLVGFSKLGALVGGTIFTLVLWGAVTIAGFAEARGKRRAQVELAVEPSASSTGCGWIGPKNPDLGFRVWKCRTGESYDLDPDVTVTDCPGCPRRVRVKDGHEARL